MIIIPSIDLINGHCVRLHQGKFHFKKIYSDDPVKVAKKFASEGAKRIHIVDLDGASQGKPINFKTIIEIRQNIPIEIQVGGGIRTMKTAQKYLENGIDAVVIGTKAEKDQNFICNLVKKYNPSKILCSLDFKNNQIRTNGWLKKSQLTYLSLAKKLKKAGINTVVCTDISKDGTLTTPNFKSLQKLQALNMNIIASGGISSMRSLEKLQKMSIYGAIIGKALYENKISLKNAIQKYENPETSNLTKRIIPCLDIKNGRVVKGKNFRNLKDAGNPIELAKKYAQEGADELIFLDISATSENRKTLINLVRKIATNIFIPFTVGGGIKNANDVKKLLENGADKVSINTAAVENPKLITELSQKFGRQCIVVAIDAKKIESKYKVYIKSGTEKTNLEAVEWAKRAEKLGAGEILLTSIDKDGTGKGYDLELLSKISSSVKIPVIASGGAGTVSHLKKALTDGKADAVLLASLLHYKKNSIEKIKEYLKQTGIPIR